ncbi:response regulator [Caulobacter sp. B11]|uniref:ATP-binding response regulator n=1 Tax=Caulobacter sp. B11 TaxID=2048899 RepID=UPI001F0254A7|nr:response regulator [Caulobacter sp. B11]
MRDTGIGVSAGFRERIFDSFTQADDAISRRHGGTGLGLTISRALALQMGGDLVLEDNAEGATFLFTLDVETAHPPAPVEVAEDLVCDLTAVRILVAEDNAINQLVVRAILEAAGMTLTMVDDGRAALAALKSERFDAVLMDINMPVMDGMTALAEIRRDLTGAATIPVIAVTASALAGDRERFLAMGFDDHLGKPIRPEELLTAIAMAIQPSASLIRKAG